MLAAAIEDGRIKAKEPNVAPSAQQQLATVALQTIVAQLEEQKSGTHRPSNVPTTKNTDANLCTGVGLGEDEAGYKKKHGSKVDLSRPYLKFNEHPGLVLDYAN